MSDDTLDIDRYSRQRAEDYVRHHRKSPRTTLTTWRERQVLTTALRLAGSPDTVLDLPCGTGRFWPAIEAAGVRELIAADNSEGMLAQAALARLSPTLPTQLLRTSAFAIDLPDGCVPFVASMRFFHHLARAEDRLTALRELHRVTTDHVAISLWVDGNVQAWRRRLQPEPVVEAGYGKRRCIARMQWEAEVARAGFSVARRWSMWPGLTMWALYLLKKQ